MYPSYLHKNILQLDKQISLLEDQCKNMDVEKRKKPGSLNPKCSKASRVSSFKCPTKKIGSENLKGSKKISPPFSARVQSVCSLQSNYSKPCSEIIVGERKTKQRGVNTNPHVFPAQVSDCDDFQSKFKMEKSCKAASSPHLNKKPSSCGDGGREQILHKEVVFSNPGEEIEVTVTKKLNNAESKKNFNNLENLSDVDSCKYKEQKWSEILGLEPVRRKESSSGNLVKKNIIDEIQANSCRIMQVLSNRNLISNTKEKNLENNFEIPEKLIRQPSKGKKVECDIQKPEKEIQCQLDKSDTEVAAPQLMNNNIPGKALKSLISELEHKPSTDSKKLLAEMEFLLNEFIQKEKDNLTAPVVDMAKNEPPLKSSSQRKEVYNAMKEHCENLMKEKELLIEEVAGKDKTIAAMKKREEEYLSLISSLKQNLEKTKEKAQDGIKALQELNTIKQKFLEQMKVSDALKKSYSKCQEIMQRCILENDKLKTQLQIVKLESKKNDFLLSGKEAEIKRYREELENFQRQISEHLASLKSNAQAVDFEKVMEAIIQQSHVFTHNDSDSLMTEREHNSSKQCNGLLHSSPTSRKNSDVNSSWKQISSIADRDQSIVSSNLFADLNLSKEKEFLQVYGEEDSPEVKNLNETIVEKKKSSSFTSCMSARDDVDCGYSSTSKNEIVPGKENSVSGSEPKEPLSSKKIQSSIDELLEKMKLQWSKEIQENSPDNCTIDDFLNNSQISSISVVSEKIPFLEALKKTKRPEVV